MAEPVSLQTLLTYLTLISVPVGVFYHIMTLRNTRKNQELTLETRQAQMFMGICNQMNRADFIDAWRAVKNIEWSNYEEYKKTREDPVLGRHLWVLGWFWEPLGVLVKNKLLPIHLVAETITGYTRLWWEKHIPIIEEGRRENNIPRWFSETEYLHNELMKYIDEHPELAT